MNKTTKTVTLPCLFLSALALGLYFHIRGFGFTYLDDAALIIDASRNFARDPSFILKIFTQNHLAVLQPQIFYRPVFAASFMINSVFSPNNLAGYYFTNIAFHAAASCMVFILLLKLKYAKNAAMLLAALYVVHPMLTQAVAWLPGRSDTLAAVFSIFSFMAFMDFMDTAKFRCYFLHLAALALALFSKENAVSLVIVCFIYSRLILRRKLFSREENFLAAGWLVVLTLWFMLRHAALKDPLRITIFEAAGFLVTNSIAIVQYIGRIFFPFDLSIWPTVRDSQWIPGAAAIMILSGLLYISKSRRMNYALFGAAWFMLFLLPALIRPGTGISASFSNTRAYLSVTGILMMLAETDMIKCADIRKWKHAVIILCVLAFYSLIALEHSYDFRNGAAFWANARRTSPHSWLDPEDIKD